MAILTEGVRSLEFLVSEANDWRSRDEVTVTVAADTTLAPGTILGKLTATGKYVVLDTTESPVTGSETETAVLGFALTNSGESAADFSVTVIARDAEVTGSDLTYETGANAAAKLASNAGLAAFGIIVR